MNELKHIEPTEIAENNIKLIGKDWMLVTSADRDGSLVCGKDYNTMTASWGGTGFLWNKPVAFVFVRPQRHTFEFTERNDRITLSFFDESYRKALSFCGKYSGRDYDKAKECALTPAFDMTEHGRAVWFSEAKLVLKTRKLYADFISPEKMTDLYPMYTYAELDFHKMYICEIEEALSK